MWKSRLGLSGYARTMGTADSWGAFRTIIGSPFGRQACFGSPEELQIGSDTGTSTAEAAEAVPLRILSNSHPKHLFLIQSLSPKEQTATRNSP
jgi:hypothetical protein